MISKINSELIKARKSRDIPRSNVLILLKTELINNEKEQKPKKDIDVLISYKKKLIKSMKAFPEGSKAKNDLLYEQEVVSEFLPEELSEEKVRETVKQVIDKLGRGNKGAVIGTTMKILQRQADGSVVARIVDEELRE